MLLLLIGNFTHAKYQGTIATMIHNALTAGAMTRAGGFGTGAVSFITMLMFFHDYSSNRFSQSALCR